MWNRIVWFLVMFLIVTIPLLSYPILQEDNHPVNATVGNSVMVSIMLIVWSLCMSWIIYNCAINRGGVLSKILSAKFLHPLSRLSFSAYLSHLMLIWFNTHQVRYPIAINVVTLVSPVHVNRISVNLVYKFEWQFCRGYFKILYHLY